MANDSIDIAVGNDHKTELVDIVEEYITWENSPEDRKTLGGRTISDLTAKCTYEDISISRTSEHTRAYMKIQDGCNQFCSYCAIPLARGRVRSRDRKSVVSEAKRLARNGYREVVITGIHLSSYGLNESYNEFAKTGNTNTELLSVIEEVSRVQGINRIRLGSLEPRLLTDEFVSGLASIDKICPHFHLSLQSGSDTVLKRMNRHYTKDEFMEKTGLLRRSFEHPAITTDIIVGFPGESEEEFKETRSFLDRADLYECHIFKYSRRKGTAADRMEGQLTDAVKSARSAVLIEDSNRRKRDFASYYLGKKVEVLTEDTEIIKGQSYTVGYTPEYVKAMLPVTESGRITRILCFDKLCDTMLIGNPCETP